MKGRPKGQEEAWAAAYCYVFLPSAFLYVLWVLAHALGCGKRRLYFLSGESYLIYLIAWHICEQWQFPLECRYLYLPGEAGIRGSADMPGIPAKHVRRAGETEGEKRRQEDMQEGDPQQKPARRETHRVTEDAPGDSGRQAALLGGYLEQEGLLGDVPYALVCGGWSGRRQKRLLRLLKKAGYRERVEGYYFGLYHYAGGMEERLCHSWYFSPAGGHWKKAFFSRNLFDCVFASPEGENVGYCVSEGRYVPVFGAEGNPNRKRIETEAAVLLKYAEYYTGDFGSGKDRMGRNPRLEMCVVTWLLSSFMGFASEEEARAFGSYRMDSGSRQAVLREVWPQRKESRAGGREVEGRKRNKAVFFCNPGADGQGD